MTDKNEMFVVKKPEEWFFNPFESIGHRAMILTATKPDGTYNMMTASWGTVGTLWGRNVCTVYIRPQRYTYEFAEAGSGMALCFFDQGYADVLRICGSKSGRDIDKTAVCHLTPAFTPEGIAYFAEAREVVIAKKIYAQDLREELFLDQALCRSIYPIKDYHRAYVCEILRIMTKE